MKTRIFAKVLQSKLYLILLSFFYFSAAVAQTTLTSISPANGRNLPATQRTVTFEFSDPIDANSLNSNNLYLIGQYSGFIQGSFSGGGTSTIIFNSNKTFIPGEPVYVYVSQNLGISKNISSVFYVSNNKTSKFSYSSSSTNFNNTYRKDIVPVDIDMDGDIDIIGDTIRGSKEGWYENNGQGVFKFKEFLAGYTPLHAFDADGDNDMDIISENIFRAHFLHINNNGVFTDTAHLRINNSDRFQTADLNGDGLQEIVYNVNGSVYVLKNIDGKRFTSSTLATESSDIYTSLRIFDVDNDNDLDIIYKLGGGNATWYKNDGSGNFSLGGSSAIGDNFALGHMYNSDKTSDEFVDFITSRLSNGVVTNRPFWTYHSTGTGAMFPFTRTKEFFINGVPNAPSMSDLRGDGISDLIFADNGTLYAVSQVDTGFVPATKSILGSVTNDNNLSSSFFYADFNKDGFTDILTTSIPLANSSTVAYAIFYGTAQSPKIDSAKLALDNSYVDLYFDKAVYGNTNKTGAITSSALDVLFYQSGGTATNVTILSVNKPDSTDYDVAGKLAGGEKTVRVFLDITGYPDGKEKIEIVPADGAALYGEDGTAIIPTETSDTLQLNAYVTVNAASVSIDKVKVDLFVGGDSDSLTATVLPKKTTNKSVTWSSSNTLVATVDANGNVTPVSEGKADITVTTVDGGLTATSAITVHPIADRVFNQDGFSSSGFILKNPLTDEYDLKGVINYNGSTPISWGSVKSILYDKKETIWLIPASITSGVAFIRVNTTTKAVEKTIAKADFSMSVNAAVMVDDDIWFVPSTSDFVIKWNTKTFTSTKYNSWPSGVTFQNNSDKFLTGFYDGQKIWICGGHDNKVISIDAKTGEMKTYTWPTVRTYNGSGYTNALTANSFRGAVFDGHNIWFAPFMADRLVKLDTRTEQMTGYETWPANFDKIDPRAGAFGQRFYGGVFDGNNVWLIPYSAGSYIKVDTATGSMESFGNWPTGIKQSWDDQNYWGGVFDGKYIWSAPYFTAVGKSKAVIRFNTENGDIAKYENYPTTIPFRDNSTYFTGGVFDGKQVWFAGTGNNLQAFPLIYMGVPDVPVSSVSLDKDTITVRVGGPTEALNATVSPSNATDKSVSWSSTNTGIANVTSSGVVSGVATGTAKILVTTTDGSFKDTTVVIVLDRDSDGDGVNDSQETADGTDKNDPKDFKDSDGDGVPDAVENEDGTDPNDKKSFKDTDDGGVPDYVEEILLPVYGLPATDPNDDIDDTTDTDKDGVPDYKEILDGTDPSNSTSYKDSDNDLVPDSVEEADLSDSTDSKQYKDSDGDGVPDYIEAIDGTDPNDKTKFKDTDGGGMPDYVETVLLPNYGMDANDENDASDDTKDSDGDGVSDFQEVIDGTDPNDPGKYKDSDGDAVPDAVEVIDGTSPTDKNSFKDTDNGGVPDYVETVLLPNYGLPVTDPNDNSDDDKTSDYDKDGVPDFEEFRDGSDPKDSTDYKDNDGDHVPDYIELVVDGTDNNNPSSYKDSDGDGIPDYVEDIDGTDPSDKTDYKDSDDDGVPDFIEELFEKTDPTDSTDYKDNDGDLIPNYIELEKDITDDNNPSNFKDSDGDRVPDYIEERDGTDPNDKTKFKESDGDGVPDYTEQMEGTDPNDKSKWKDTDGDGVPDYIEKNEKTDPAVKNEYKDSDGDGVPDYVENNESTDASDKTKYKDSDGDGVPDYTERIDGTDPADNTKYKDSDGDSVPDYVERIDQTDPALNNDYKDSDGDGVPDYVEKNDGTDPADNTKYKDSDGDLVPDYIEKRDGTNPANKNDFKDSDTGGVPDYVEDTLLPNSGLTKTDPSDDADDNSDFDGDGKSDYDELVDGTNPNDAPATITYSPSSLTATKGVEITEIIPTFTGGKPKSYVISPDLPTGMIFDATTGKISGNPGELQTTAVTYTITATNDGGNKTVTFTLTVNDAAPSVTYTPTAAVATKGNNVTITPISSGGTVVNYQISPALPANLTINQNTGVISGIPSAVNTTTVTYTVTATNSGGTVTTTFTLVIKDAPPSNLSYSPASQRATKNVAINTMTPSSSGGTVVSYSIAPALPGGLLFNTSTGSVSGTLTETLSGSVEYTITATNSGGSTTTKLTIVYNTPPSDLSISKANIFDLNAIGDLIGTFTTTDVDENETHTYTLVTGQGSTHNSAFRISGDKLLANRVYNYDAQRSYSIRVRTTDKGGLYHDEVINVTISKTPKVQGSSSALYYGLVNNKPVISLGTQSQLQIDPSGIQSVLWSPGTGLSATNILNPIATPKVTTTYTVTITNIYGSVTTLSITVEVKNDYSIEVSNIVTPNNDGINDFWVIDNIQNYPDNEVTIFDRNGKLLYKTANYNNRWDGRVNGKLLATGTYYYLVRFRNNPNALHKGYLTLVNE